MVMIEVGSPKMAREMLCAIQTQIDITQMPSREYHARRIQSMIDQLDVHRPLGPDGKHGDLHTETCGCEDKGVYCLNVQIIGHESAQAEVTTWSDNSVTYRHRVLVRGISGSYWGKWQEGKGN